LTCQENPVSTTTCASQSLDGELEFTELDNAQDSDSEEESADDTEVTLVTTCESERYIAHLKILMNKIIKFLWKTWQ